MVRTADKDQVTKGMQTTMEKTRNPVKRKPAKLLLEVNTKVKSRLEKQTTWIVTQHIGSGGFGDVYRVKEESEPTNEFAMKTEMLQTPQRRLHLERSILKEMDDYATEHKKTRHFCRLIDSGRALDYSWIVMTLIGPSLDHVRRLLKKQFSKPCVVNMALQILEAVETMHDVGFIHRDLKPGNVCTGMPPKEENTLFVLDFGISRRIFKNVKSRELRKKRENVRFFGTKKFCSRACHLEKDQGRKDDMETYVYTILDLFHNEKGLTWSRDLQDVKKVVEKKKALFANPTKELDPTIPGEIARIVTYLGTLQFHDAVDYRLIETEIRSIRKEKTTESGYEAMDWSNSLSQLLEEARKNQKTSEPEKGEETKEMERLLRRGRDTNVAAMSEKQQMSSAAAMTREQMSEGGGITGGATTSTGEPIPAKAVKRSRKSTKPRKFKSRATIGK